MYYNRSTLSKHPWGMSPKAPAESIWKNPRYKYEYPLRPCTAGWEALSITRLFSGEWTRVWGLFSLGCFSICSRVLWSVLWTPALWCVMPLCRWAKHFILLAYVNVMRDWWWSDWPMAQTHSPQRALGQLWHYSQVLSVRSEWMIPVQCFEKLVKLLKHNASQK